MERIMARGGEVRPTQFSLADLFEFTSVCCIVAALSAVTGVAASVLLMAMALAIGARQGLFALAMLVVACLAADASRSLQEGQSTLPGEMMVLLEAACMCWWYGLRRAHFLVRANGPIQNEWPNHK